MAAAADEVFSGETTCTRPGCKRKAYYYIVVPQRSHKKQYLCGAHSRKFQNVRSDMKKRSAKDKAEQTKRKLEAEMPAILEAQRVNQENKQRGGQIVLDQLKGRFGHPVDQVGFFKIFPNHKHQNRLDGFGCKSLSPKVMGPINHGQPTLPPAKNLENLHQVRFARLV